jgi:hypothetical protein
METEKASVIFTGKNLFKVHSSFITEILMGVALVELHFYMADTGIQISTQ